MTIKRQETALLERIRCEKALEQNQQSIEQIFDIIANPAKLWNSANADGKRRIQQTIFPDGFCINTESKKCGPDKISPLYSVISNKKEHNSSDSSNMSISWMSGDICKKKSLRLVVSSNDARLIDRNILKSKNRRLVVSSREARLLGEQKEFRSKKAVGW